MVEFKTLDSDEIEFGEDEFIEIARKKSVSGEGEKEFVSLSRGVVDDGERRYKSNFSVPMDEEVIDFILSVLPSMSEEN